MGVRESGIAEDMFVYAKVLIILFATGAGFFAFKRAAGAARPRARPFPRARTAALIFVAYEGFELLTYDY